MKYFLIFVFLFINSVFNYNAPKSSYSLLLDEIRTNIIDSALLNLPKREEVDLLKMNILMVLQKKQYSLTDVESAFLIYKWISQNIKINCYYYYYNSHGIKKEELPIDIYDSGNGQPPTISSLFNLMCSYMNVKSDSIQGYYKTLNYSEYYTQFSEAVHIWNYILIDNQTYLVDPTLGNGYCDDTTYYKSSSDFYFGTRPEILIKSHFPNDDKFQLLKEIITKAQWSSFVFRRYFFYLNGLKTITPDSRNINIENIKKIVIDYDSSNYDIGVGVQLYFYGGDSIIMNHNTCSNGRIEISLEKWYKPSNSNPNRIEIRIGTKNNPWAYLVVHYYISGW